MDKKQKDTSTQGDGPAETGNASNPVSTGNATDNSSQLLDKKAEKYLREAGNIEDMPDDEDQQDMEESLDKEKGE